MVGSIVASGVHERMMLLPLHNEYSNKKTSGFFLFVSWFRNESFEKRGKLFHHKSTTSLVTKRAALSCFQSSDKALRCCWSNQERGAQASSLCTHRTHSVVHRPSDGTRLEPQCRPGRDRSAPFLLVSRTAHHHVTLGGRPRTP